MKTFILVPVYNEGKVFEQWLPSLILVAKEMGALVVIVDDGSEEKFLSSQFSDRADHVLDNCILMRHEVNCGVGAALATGLEYARQQEAEVVLTIDGDGQHNPEDLKGLLAVLKSGSSEVVNGSRFLKQQSIPLTRRVANFLGNIITFALSGFWLTDSQSGMKGFSQIVLEKIRLQTPGYEWCSDVFREANWFGFRIEEVPISVVYNLYTLRKGQGFAVGLDVVFRLMIRSLMKSGRS